MAPPGLQRRADPVPPPVRKTRPSSATAALLLALGVAVACLLGWMLIAAGEWWGAAARSRELSPAVPRSPGVAPPDPGLRVQDPLPQPEGGPSIPSGRAMLPAPGPRPTGQPVPDSLPRKMGRFLTEEGEANVPGGSGASGTRPQEKE